MIGFVNFFFLLSESPFIDNFHRSFNSMFGKNFLDAFEICDEDDSPISIMKTENVTIDFFGLEKTLKFR